MRVIKDTIKRFLWRFEKDIVTRPRVISQNEDKLLEVSLHLALKDLYLRIPEMSVVQIGAYDGKSEDPLFAFLTQYNVRAILVEPQPRVFEMLKENYKNCANVDLVRAAVATKDGEMPFYVVREGSPGPEWMFKLASFDREVMLKYKEEVPGLAASIVKIVVECVSPLTLLKSHNLNSINALVVDTEGYDAQLLRAFRQAGVLPELIYFEHRNLSRNDYTQCVSELIDDGYRIAFLKYDTLAYK